MPAVRFTRKSRTIESQHGADLSRVGRNDDAREREREGGGWEERQEGLLDGMYRERRKEQPHTSIDSGNAIAGFVGSGKDL